MNAIHHKYHLCMIAVRAVLRVLSTLAMLSCVFTASAETLVQHHGALSVSGVHIVDAKGENVCLAGPSYFWSNTGWDGAAFYNADSLNYFVDQWQASWVRAAMGIDAKGGVIDDPENEQRVIALIDAAIDRGIYVLVDFHSHHAEQHEARAIDFFTRIAQKYGKQPNLIYEIYNEPLDKTDWTSVIKPYAERVIQAIRRVDPDNLIIVGTQSWSQDVDKAADDPLVNAHNVAYSLHFYANTHKEALRKKALYAIHKGLPIVVTEWGSVSATGDGQVNSQEVLYWFGLIERNQLSHAHWSVSDKKEAASIFKPGRSMQSQWTDADLSTSGLLAKTLISTMAKNNAVNGSIASCRVPKSVQR